MLTHVVLLLLLQQILFHDCKILAEPLSNDYNDDTFSSVAHNLKKRNSLNKLDNANMLSLMVKSINEPLSTTDADGNEARIIIPGPIPIDTEKIKQITSILGYIGNQILPAILDVTGSLNTENIVQK